MFETKMYKSILEEVDFSPNSKIKFNNNHNIN